MVNVLTGSSRFLPPPKQTIRGTMRPTATRKINYLANLWENDDDGVEVYTGGSNTWIDEPIENLSILERQHFSQWSGIIAVGIGCLFVTPTGTKYAGKRIAG